VDHFTPFSAAVGGAIIGIATTLLWVANGRTAGISTIAGSVFLFHRRDVLWRLLFLIGLPLGGYLGAVVGPSVLAEIPANAPKVDLSAVGLVASGLLVGIGTRMGRGCTSGHGICGLARLSPRSMVAVGTFMAMAVITVFAVRHVI
jgi:uncharacterized membrane protein YedE/YeeE